MDKVLLFVHKKTLAFRCIVNKTLVQKGKLYKVYKAFKRHAIAKFYAQTTWKLVYCRSRNTEMYVCKKTVQALYYITW